MLPLGPIEVREYLDARRNSAFRRWFDSIDSHAAQKVSAATMRLEQGNFSNVKSVGKGLLERRIDFGPGYRIYFGIDGGRLIILLGGSTKQRQTKAIGTAQELWREYKTRKRRGDQRLWH